MKVCSNGYVRPPYIAQVPLKSQPVKELCVCAAVVVSPVPELPAEDDSVVVVLSQKLLVYVVVPPPALRFCPTKPPALDPLTWPAAKLVLTTVAAPLP